jgi:hypothetical protein
MNQAIVVIEFFAGLDMSRSALMKIRPPCSSASQLGPQEWLIQREELPPYQGVNHMRCSSM